MLPLHSVRFFDSAEDDDRLSGGTDKYKTKIRIDSKGRHTWLAPAMFKSVCDINTRYLSKLHTGCGTVGSFPECSKRNWPSAVRGQALRHFVKAKSSRFLTEILSTREELSQHCVLACTCASLKISTRCVESIQIHLNVVS